MSHVLVAVPIHLSGLACLEAAPGVTREMVEEVSEPFHSDRIGGADALTLRTQPLSAATVAKADRLRIVSRHGVGTDAADEEALTKALRDGRLAAAGPDVFDEEPPPPNHPLLAFGSVILSPHIASLAAESAESMAVVSVPNVLDFFAGRLDPSLIVNRDVRDA